MLPGEWRMVQKGELVSGQGGGQGGLGDHGAVCTNMAGRVACAEEEADGAADLGGAMRSFLHAGGCHIFRSSSVLSWDRGE